MAAIYDPQMTDSRPVVGLLSPGAMGAQVGACLVEAGHTNGVLFAGDGRSEATLARAGAAGLRDVGTATTLINESDVILSICPPASAVEVSRTAKEEGFSGLFVDANAVSPATARLIGADHDRLVDGGIIGPPPSQSGTTRLYVSSDQRGEVEVLVELFSGSALEVRVIDGGAGAASAVKMCFAGWTKGTAALLFSIRALAEAEGVSEALLGEWATSMPELIARSERSAPGVGPKAWRFEGEMHEIAATFASQGLPDGFHLAAAETYRRLASLKGRTDSTAPATLDEVISLLRP